MKTGIVINNIGTPKGHDAAAMKDYLGEFLMDPDVINIPYPLRWLLVKQIIVPRRAKTSGEKYEKIWTPEGSPLMVETKMFADQLQKHLGDNYEVRIGMRYGNPSIEDAIKSLLDQGVGKILFCPMYPQYAAATTFSSEQKFLEVYRKMSATTPLYFLKPFFAAPAFIDPSSEMLGAALKEDPSAKVLFSFHGLPESHVKKVSGCLVKDGCCELPGACEKNCYRAQCLSTAKRIALRAGVAQYLVSFQSRLGPAKWIGPSSVDTVQKEAANGTKSLVVMTPAFVADGLESLEEVDMELRELFLSNGGKRFSVVRCLNADPRWIEGFSGLLEEKTQWREVAIGS